MLYQKINFDKNYNNKLNQNIFTTIRKGKNYQKYLELENQEFEIYINNKIHSRAILTKVVYIKQLKNIPLPFLYSDTGYTHNTILLELFKKFEIDTFDPVIVLCFEKNQVIYP